MKNSLSGILNLLFPFTLKKKLFALWLRSDPGFWLETKRKLYEPDYLTSKRFTANSLNRVLHQINERFGRDVELFFTTDERMDLFMPSKMKYLENVERLRNLPESKEKIVVCAFESDEYLLEVLSSLKKIPNCYYYTPYQFLPTARYFHRNNIAKSVLKEELAMHRGKFDLPDFENIIQALDITRPLDGDYVEIGVFRGDSAIVATKYMERMNDKRQAYFIDIFEGFTNVASIESKDAFWFDSHQDTSFKGVKNLLLEYPTANVIKSDIITDNLPKEITRISCCNIDVDLYEAVVAALEKVAPLVQTGGIIILEDQGHTPLLAGALMATFEFLESEMAKRFVPVHMLSGQMFLIKIR